MTGDRARWGCRPRCHPNVSPTARRLRRTTTVRLKERSNRRFPRQRLDRVGGLIAIRAEFAPASARAPHTTQRSPRRGAGWRQRLPSKTAAPSRRHEGGVGPPGPERQGRRLPMSCQVSTAKLQAPDRGFVIRAMRNGSAFRRGTPSVGGDVGSSGPRRARRRQHRDWCSSVSRSRPRWLFAIAQTLSAAARRSLRGQAPASSAARMPSRSARSAGVSSGRGSNVVVRVLATPGLPSLPCQASAGCRAGSRVVRFQLSAGRCRWRERTK